MKIFVVVYEEQAHMYEIPVGYYTKREDAKRAFNSLLKLKPPGFCEPYCGIWGRPRRCKWNACT